MINVKVDGFVDDEEIVPVTQHYIKLTIPVEGLGEMVFVSRWQDENGGVAEDLKSRVVEALERERISMVYRCRRCNRTEHPCTCSHPDFPPQLAGNPSA